MQFFLIILLFYAKLITLFLNSFKKTSTFLFSPSLKTKIHNKTSPRTKGAVMKWLRLRFSIEMSDVLGQA